MMNDSERLPDLLAPEDEPAPTRGLSIGSWVLIGGVAVFALVILVALLRQSQTQPTSGQAPDFTITTFDGAPFNLAAQRGNVVVVNFWASWCAPCRDEAPLLEQLWQDYRDRGVVVVGVAYSDVDSNSQAFIREFGITYPNGPDTGTRISKNDYHIIGVPETFIIDQQGNIRRFFFQVLPDTGRGDDDLFVRIGSVRATIDALLAEGETPS
ncbi:MAG: TlpA disulfide reductase family protein [bacterium]|nr:TlpA disulfide reductase family protein [bacterium]